MGIVAENSSHHVIFHSKVSKHQRLVDVNGVFITVGAQACGNPPKRWKGLNTTPQISTAPVEMAPLGSQFPSLGRRGTSASRRSLWTAQASNSWDARSWFQSWQGPQIQNSQVTVLSQAWSSAAWMWTPTRRWQRCLFQRSRWWSRKLKLAAWPRNQMFASQIPVLMFPTQIPACVGQIPWSCSVG